MKNINSIGSLLGMMFFSVFFAVCSNAFAEASINDLENHRQEVNSQLGQDQDHLSQVQGQLMIAKKDLKLKKEQRDEAKNAYRAKQKVAMDDPTISTEDSRQNYLDRSQQFQQAEDIVKDLELKVQKMQSAVDTDNTQLKTADRNLSELREKMLRAEIEQVKTVQAHGEAGCSDSSSFGQCKDAALADAKRKAAEQTVSMIESDTKVKNFVVQSDNLHTHVYALIKSVKIIKKGIIGEGIGYFYDIEAVVQGQYGAKKKAKKRKKHHRHVFAPRIAQDPPTFGAFVADKILNW